LRRGTRILTVNAVKKLTMRRSLVLNTWELAGTNTSKRPPDATRPEHERKDDGGQGPR
jgi:hypothetical protein